jgi:hypothetical protein
MKKLKLSAMGLMLALVLTASASKVKKTEGSVAALKGQKQINVEFVYQDFKVGNKQTETEYVNKKVSDYNKKEAGRGDKWKASWEGDRKARYEPHFFELFNKVSGLEGGDFPSAKYTLIVKTKRIEPGYNIPMISQKYAEVDLEIWLVETANKGKALAKYTVEKAPGRTYGGADWDTGVRIAEAYEKAAKDFGNTLAKDVKKSK